MFKLYEKYHINMAYEENMENARYAKNDETPL
jgi:hypothetical protein